MTAVKEFFKRCISDSGEENYILLAVISCFLPYFLSAVCLLFVVLRALFVKSVRKTFLKGFDAYLVAAFFALNLVTPIVFKNYVGIACFFAVTLMMVLAMYIRAYMTSGLFSRISDAIGAMSITSALVAALQKIVYSNEIPSLFFHLKNRAPSVFFNPNYYGTVITFVVLLCVYRLLTGSGNKIFNLVVIAANIAGLLMADCQSAFFCIAFGVWILLLLTKKYKLFAAVTVVAVVGVIFLPKLTFIMPRISNFAENIFIRSTIWQAGLKGFLDTPIFGRGMMGYLQIWETYGGQQNFHCHNLFIDILLSFGVLGSAPLVIFGVKNVACVKGKKYAPLLLSLVGAVILHSLVDVTLAWIQTGALAVFFLSSAHINEEA